MSKPLDQEGLSLARYRVLVEGEEPSVSSLILHSNRNVFNFWVALLSLRTWKRRVRKARFRLHSPKEGKSDQFALYMVTPPQGLSTPGDITTTVTDNPVLTQDPPPVLDSARPSSSTPVKQEGTAAQPLEVSVEVHVVPDSEQDAADVSEGPVGALSRMSLVTQVGSELFHQTDQSQCPSWSTGDESALCLKVDQTKSMVDAYNQIRAELQLARDPVSGGEELAPLPDYDMAAFEQLVLRLGLENVPYLQPKQLTKYGSSGICPCAYGSQDPAGSIRGRRL